MNKKKRLGRGLEALLSATSELEHSVDVSQEPDRESTTSDTVQLSVYEIDDNPFQPRREFSESEIASLTESLKSHDMLQPILVRVVNDRYQLISGERRLRAAIQAGWSTIPARVRQADDRLVAELAIVENLQRKDLNAIEKALSFRRYIDEHGCTQEHLAGRLKIDRSTLTNLMRLLELPTLVQDALRGGSITMGHARALLPLGDERVQLEFCNRIQKEGISVRQTERDVAERIAKEDGAGSVAPKKKTQNQQIEALQHELKMALGTRVDLRQNTRGNGRITIHFADNREFDRLRAILSGGSPQQRAA
ncbi:MAG: ParB/RepB/Spo0J family partition protein [Planctomycetaceae bacterium]|nr:ParB/RepB/Spo0J family partition protein [Planctomycetaceae bacterium]MCP4463041.1 ParB/RepB/Spo0J family partition protein [Planctomycetaceae bacterium]MDG1810203.1 ParB/RepB/Spo0J family partition protein [Pirellulaceae bacterium]MDG2103480.1 ParB/RepB/Spo0J family partition protein [Pirellulaceae bacterium]